MPTTLGALALIIVAADVAMQDGQRAFVAGRNDQDASGFIAGAHTIAIFGCLTKGSYSAGMAIKLR
jgi:hypothetical protein